jgi:hypothetical protein
MKIDELGTAGAMFFDIGGIVELIPNLHFGAYISNITLSRLNSPEKSELPVIMKIGFSYRPIQELKLNFDLFKDNRYDPNIKAGIEYLIASKFFIRTGINTQPVRSFFGIGVKFQRFKVDYAISNNDFLGIAHHLGVSFAYTQKDE